MHVWGNVDIQFTDLERIYSPSFMISGNNSLNGLSAWSPIVLFAKQTEVKLSHFKVANTFQAIVLGFV